MYYERIYLIIQFFFFTFILTNASLNECIYNVPNFNNDLLILETLNGKIMGSCYKIEINDPHNPNMTDYIISWKGIPFAEPPINENRFKNPVPIKQWTDVKNGTMFSNICMQPSSSSDISEDCLYLNIYVSAKSFVKYKNKTEPPKPILFYIHGGFFTGGSSRYPDPSINIAFSDIIVVTIQYRLGPFGFMHLAGSNVSGNQGFLDQHLALKWTYENADRFGGDKNKITVSGQSAGSRSTSFHLVYSPSWPYFNSVIMESGSLLASNAELFASSELTTRTKNVFKNSGCDFEILSSKDFETCIQQINPSIIFRESDRYFNDVILKGDPYAFYLNPLFQLVVDGIEFKEPFKESIRNRRFKKVNTLSGFNSEEYAVFLKPIFGLKEQPVINLTEIRKILNNFYPYFPRYPLRPPVNFTDNLINLYTKNCSLTDYFRTVIQILSEEFYISPQIHLAEIYSETNEAYLFSFEQFNPSSSLPNWYGAVHGSEFSFVYGSPLEKKNAALYSDKEKILSKKMIFYWTNFVKFSNPNANATLIRNNDTYWPPMSKIQNHIIMYNSSIRIATDFTYRGNMRQLDFWKTYENF